VPPLRFLGRFGFVKRTGVLIVPILYHQVHNSCKNMALLDSKGVITIAAGQVSFLLPHNEIDVPALTDKLGANSAKEVKIHIVWRQPEEERAQKINAMLEALGGKPSGFSKDVIVFATADNGNKKEIRGFRTYVTRLIK